MRHHECHRNIDAAFVGDSKTEQNGVKSPNHVSGSWHTHSAVLCKKMMRREFLACIWDDETMGMKKKLPPHEMFPRRRRIDKLRFLLASHALLTWSAAHITIKSRFNGSNVIICAFSPVCCSIGMTMLK